MATQVERIAIIGLMGSGKSTIGRGVAEALGWPFVDMDRAIEERSGKSVAQTFREDGEKEFRNLEQAVLREFTSQPAPLVLATGGGTPLDAENRKLLRNHFTVVWLCVRPEESARRLAGATDRPLLEGGDPESKLASLLEERADLYSRVAALALDPAEPRTLVRSITRWTIL